MDMRQTFKAVTFWLATVVVAVVFFVVAMGTNKTFQVETDILLLPKNDWTARNIDQIIGNAKQIPMSLSFYDKLLEKNSDIEDSASQLADAQRKSAWNAMVSVEQIRRSGVVRVKTFNDVQLQAEIVNKQTAADLIFVMGKYYTMEDLGMKKIDGPIVSAVTKKDSVAKVAMISLVLGLLVGLLFQFLLTLFAKNSDGEDLMVEEFVEQPREMEDEKKSFSFPKFSFPDFGQAFGDKKTLDFNIEEEAALVAPKMNELIGGEKKAAAPANLPIAEEDFSFSATPAQPVEKTESAEMIVSDAVAKDTTHEATPEEVKERLNKLLSGGIFK
ncbi:MAG: hypothetical protein Q7T51_04395 [Candidatus Moranbacteria bacterium]|nr:hypothetical protein [Candidatus Moranbacteria bacterium]